jgi:hypothetical protein
LGVPPFSKKAKRTAKIAFFENAVGLSAISFLENSVKTPFPKKGCRLHPSRKPHKQRPLFFLLK